MKFAITLCLVGLCGIALATHHGSASTRGVSKVADKDFLENQKNILRLLMHVNQPNSFQDQIQIAKTYKIVPESYSDESAAKEFIKLYQTDMLPRKAIFSVLDDKQRYQAATLFRIFYSAKTYEIFYKTAAWARDNVNEGIFVYALTMAVLHRNDTQGMVLPAPYEIYPYYFINTEVIHKAQEYKMQDFAYFKKSVDKHVTKDRSDTWNPKFRKAVSGLDNLDLTEAVHNIPFQQEMWQSVGDVKSVIIPSNYSGWYLNVDQEQKMAYYTEDIGLNSYYYYLHVDYPFWLGGKTYGLEKDRRGELYFYTRQQLLARYYLERLSNGLGRIPTIDLKDSVDFGYEPSLQHANGLEFPRREAYTKVVRDDYTSQAAMALRALEERISTAIDSGFFYTDDGKQVSIYQENGIDILGNLIQGNLDALNTGLYSKAHVYEKLLWGVSGKPVNHYQLQPSALEHYETAMRDPIFYSIYKKIVNHYKAYKANLPFYKYEALTYPGVKIDSMDVEDLITYFDYFDVEINNALYTDFTQEQEIPEVIVKARQMRLNHKPYSYKIQVSSNKPAKVITRVFLGPKYDEFGRVIDIDENRYNFVEIDKFVYDLKAGKNVMKRNSEDAYHTVQDRTSYYQLYQQVMSAMAGQQEFVLDNSEAHCGYPNRLLLPKGKKGGMVYQMYVIVSPYNGRTEKYEKEGYSCGVGSGLRYLDDLPMGWPLDRTIYAYGVFKTPNMYFKDVVIYHKHFDEIKH